MAAPNHLYPAILLFCIFGLVTSAHAQDRGTISTEACPLEYIIEGEGKTALIIGSARYYQRAFSPALRQDLKMVFVDHRGFACPPEIADTSVFLLEKIVEDVERTRKQLQLGKVIIIGHSGHSYMALEYAKRYPQFVTHVVIIGIAPDLGDENARLAQRFWDESVDSERKQLMEERASLWSKMNTSALTPSQAYIQNYIRDAPKIWYDADYNATPLWEGVEMNLYMFDYMWGTVFRDIDISKGLSDLHVPVFLALGRYDFLVGPPFTWDTYRSQFHDLTLRIFEKSGHTPPTEQPEEFNEALLEWMQEH